MPGDGPQVLFLYAVFLSSFGLKFSETEFCTGLGCVMEHAILSYISLLHLCFNSLNLVFHPLNIVDCKHSWLKQRWDFVNLHLFIHSPPAKLLWTFALLNPLWKGHQTQEMFGPFFVRWARAHEIGCSWCSGGTLISNFCFQYCANWKVRGFIFRMHLIRTDLDECVLTNLNFFRWIWL